MSAAVEKIRHSVEDAVDVRLFSSGHNAALYLLDCKGGARYIAKVAERPDARLDLEGWMLEYLARHCPALPLPEVILAEPGMLIMSYLANAGIIDHRAQAHAAELLASLHAVRGETFGLERDTVIGPLPQRNTPEDDWLTFFRDHRLLFMAQAALDDGRIDSGMMGDIEKLAGKLGEYIDGKARPSLLHGDAWGGNVLAAGGRITGFIDPAIYYGDPEMELAFTTLFGTFGETFFKRYGEIGALRPGFFEVRKDIYNLYPLLVHARLFGASYVQSVGRILNRLVA